MPRSKTSNRLFVITLLAAALFLGLFLVRMLSVEINRKQIEATFTPNEMRTDYQDKLPLRDIDFDSLNTVFPNISTLVAYNLQTEITAPREIRYYRDYEDLSSVALTIAKGDTVNVLVDPDNDSNLGFGIYTYPSYRKGWRYAEPVVVNGARTHEMLYVKMDDIEALIGEYYDANKGLSASNTKSQIKRYLSLLIDRQYYESGIYLSPDYYVMRLGTMDYAALILGALFLVLTLWLTYLKRNLVMQSYRST